MAKVKLTRKQISAVLVVIYNELEALFKEMKSSKKIECNAPLQEKILGDLKTLLQGSFQQDVEDVAIYNLFDSHPEKSS